MKNDVDINVRLPSALRCAIERERERVSREVGAEVKLSAIIRAALEKQFGKQRAPKARAA